MLKVAAIVPPASINLGNDFFSKGGITAFKKCFPDTEVTLIEFFDSGEKWFDTKNGLTPFFTPSTLQWIKEESDLVVLFGGCCLHSNLKKLFDDIFSTKVPFIGWGLSPTAYNSNDVSFAKYVADRSLMLITRDNIIYNMVGKYNNFMSGLDGGWWMGESYKKPAKTLNYHVVNVEKGNSLNREYSINLYKSLKEKYKDDPVYYVSNNCERDYHFMNKNSLLITSSEHLYTTISNASSVITTRAHSTICCLTNSTPVKYIGEKSNRVLGLMKSVDIDITNSKDIFETQACFEKVTRHKDEFINEVKNKVDLSNLR